jgi:hypothetical protein
MEAGIEPDAAALGSMERSLCPAVDDRGGGNGRGGGEGRSGAGGEPGGAEGEDTEGGGRDGNGGSPGGEAPSGGGNGGGRDGRAFDPLAYVKALFSAAARGGGGEGRKKAPARITPAWALLPFEFRSKSVVVSGFFRVLWSGEGAPSFMGAEFTANGSSYSFALDGDAGRADFLGPPGAADGISDALGALGFALREGDPAGEGRWTDERA